MPENRKKYTREFKLEAVAADFDDGGRVSVTIGRKNTC